MALTTPAAAHAQYAANSLYAYPPSATKAVLFIEACVALLALQPKRSKSGRNGHEVEFDPAEMRASLNKAERWYAANVGSDGTLGGRGGGVRYLDFSNSRE